MIIVHIGYPKTATTTLQRGIVKFNNDINYIGKDYKEDLLNFIYGYNNLSNREIISFFKGTKNTFISNEELSINPNIDLIINNIKKIANISNDNIKIVISIRNHADLIFSLYVQLLMGIKKQPSEYLREYIEKEKHKDYFGLFFFYKNITKFAEAFGKENIEIIFYEDLKNDRNFYIKRWSEILEVKKEIIDSIFLQEFNKKKKTDKGYLRKLDLGIIIGNIIYATNFIEVYRRYLKKVDFIKNIFKKSYKAMLNISLGEKEFKKFTQEERDIIKSIYRDDTLKLIKTFNLDENKFKKYSYL